MKLLASLMLVFSLSAQPLAGPELVGRIFAEQWNAWAGAHRPNIISRSDIQGWQRTKRAFHALERSMHDAGYDDGAKLPGAKLP